MLCVCQHTHASQAVISSHDRIANKEYPIQSVEPSGGRIDEKPVQFVRIEKRNNPLGATVKRAKDGSMSISRVLCGGAADRSGKMCVAKRLVSQLKINGL